MSDEYILDSDDLVNEKLHFGRYKEIYDEDDEMTCGKLIEFIVMQYNAQK